MDNYYDEILSEIRELISMKKYDEASLIVERELSMPYIPMEIEKTLHEMKKDIRYGKSENRTAKENSLDDLLDGLHGDAARQLASVNGLCSRNLREITDEIREYLMHDPFPEAAALLINAIAQQKIEEEFTLVRDGVEYTFEGDCLTPVDQCAGYLKAEKLLYSWLGMKYPSVYELAKKVLVHETYMFLPLCYEEDEAKDLAYECAMQTADMLQDDLLKEQIRQCAGVFTE